MNQALTAPGPASATSGVSAPKPLAKQARDLNALDRCDRCGAQAYHLLVSPTSGLELLFCHHHGQKINPGLKEQGWEHTDYSKRLLDNAKPDASPM